MTVSTKTLKKRKFCRILKIEKKFFDPTFFCLRHPYHLWFIAIVIIGVEKWGLKPLPVVSPPKFL